MSDVLGGCCSIRLRDLEEGFSTNTGIYERKYRSFRYRISPLENIGNSCKKFHTNLVYFKAKKDKKSFFEFTKRSEKNYKKSNNA